MYHDAALPSSLYLREVSGATQGSLSELSNVQEAGQTDDKGLHVTPISLIFHVYIFIFIHSFILKMLIEK